MKEFVRSVGVPVVGGKEFDAADVIAAHVNQARQEGWRVLIVTSDVWLHQLCCGDDVQVMHSRTRDITRDGDIAREWRILPPFLPDVLALAGDYAMQIKRTSNVWNAWVVVGHTCCLPMQVCMASVGFEQRKYSVTATKSRRSTPYLTTSILSVQ